MSSPISSTSLADKIKTLTNEICDLEIKINDVFVNIRKLRQDVVIAKLSIVEQEDNLDFLKEKNRVPILSEYLKSKKNLKDLAKISVDKTKEADNLERALKSMEQSLKIMQNKLDVLLKQQQNQGVVDLQEFKEKKNGK